MCINWVLIKDKDINELYNNWLACDVAVDIYVIFINIFSELDWFVNGMVWIICVLMVATVVTIAAIDTIIKRI